MTESEARALMEHHGITASQQAVYHYKGFRYRNLMDALNYAELIKSRDSPRETERQRERVIQ